MISTRGRYALRILIDLAQNDGEKFVPMKDIAARQGLSLKYLEQIIPVLTKNKLVETSHGKGGGYKLARRPEEYVVGEVLRLTEKNFTPVACLENDAEPCDRACDCITIGFWKGLNDVINNYIDSVSLADLIKQQN